MAGAVIPLIMSILNAASTIVPALTTVAPVIEKGLSGEPYSDTDLAALQVTSDALDAQVAAAEATAEASGSTA